MCATSCAQATRCRCVSPSATVRDALFQLTAKRMGMTAIVDENGRVKGIFTDGDLRRVLERSGDFRELPIASVMTPGPRTIGPDQLAVEAVELMERHRINQMLVVDDSGQADRRAQHARPLLQEGDLMAAAPLTATERARRVKLMIFDVDGVLTDGGLIFTAEGDTMKVVQLDGRPRREAAAPGRHRDGDHHRAQVGHRRRAGARN